MINAPRSRQTWWRDGERNSSCLSMISRNYFINIDVYLYLLIIEKNRLMNNYWVHCRSSGMPIHDVFLSVSPIDLSKDRLKWCMEIVLISNWNPPRLTKMIRMVEEENCSFGRWNLSWCDFLSRETNLWFSWQNQNQWLLSNLQHRWEDFPAKIIVMARSTLQITLTTTFTFKSR